jgi:hypothetical protein
MDMSVTEGSIWSGSPRPRVTSISHYFVMDWASVWKDITGELLIAKALAAWGPRLLAGILPHRSPGGGQAVGTVGRPAGGDGLVCLLDR